MVLGTCRLVVFGCMVLNSLSCLVHIKTCSICMFLKLREVLEFTSGFGLEV